MSNGERRRAQTQYDERTGLNPNIARTYNALLGGKDNLAADREQVAKVCAYLPDAPRLARLNRDFLARTVRYLAGEAGIDQFLDLGAGLPAAGNVHEVVQGINPAARVVYVDNDPVVETHWNALLAVDDRSCVVGGDIRDSDAILNHPDVLKRINFDRSVAVLLLSVLHFLPDDEPYELVRHVVKPLVPGSQLVISHGEATAQVVEAAKVYTATTAAPRSREQIEALFDGWHLAWPHVVPLPLWRPETEVTPTDTDVPFVGGVARKPWWRDDMQIGR